MACCEGQGGKDRTEGRKDKGTKLACDVCGMVVTVDDPCRCDACDLVCCGREMRETGCCR